MDIERLIESVRSRKILYVTTSKSYKNSSKKKLGGTWLMKWPKASLTGRLQALGLLGTGWVRVSRV